MSVSPSLWATCVAAFNIFSVMCTSAFITVLGGGWWKLCRCLPSNYALCATLLNFLMTQTTCSPCRDFYGKGCLIVVSSSSQWCAMDQTDALLQSNSSTHNWHASWSVRRSKASHLASSLQTTATHGARSTQSSYKVSHCNPSCLDTRFTRATVRVKSNPI